ncbi:MAG: hypothetical protein COU28_03065 [Candidatus Magasanikbacteria bacterium CG10_big_fil_rev_8_21_14_0_10_36_16]|uniref:Response regulatory domain-containing protein n=1 Tax=Candidatus Magasanikbacteria bacterium CG10_big_fil_rev_8_21_14_0_10_36_16 TaxID=1974645 RepID=A0A2H0TY78_9BACT|nr:MAG: hypothetical protein COU28_03065 [Candidatus Magasanikbacteria bacterium CG10_big_fil_rev_8_21_14_0_10_36_16]
MNKKLLFPFLSIFGFDVLEVYNGEEGLKIALEQQPDFILSDIKMPVMDGIQMITKIRHSGDWGKAVHILMLTQVWWR